jgi:beta-glucanase (GH16 family)
MNRWRLLFVMMPVIAACTEPPVDEPLPEPPVVGDWKLTFNDEFDGPAGSAPDPANWVHDVGGNGWGNQQLEFNTAERANSRLDGDGHLVISTLRQRFGNNDYTSARLRSEGRFEHGYGRFEASIKLPTGAGLWPAFWLLSTEHDTVGWPECGELDIMELRGSEPGVVHGSAHGPGYSGANPKTNKYQLGADRSFADGFHTFALEWSPGEVHWFVDGKHFHAIRQAEMPREHRWVFDGEMFLILNVAVGGWFGGDVDDSVFPQTMEVDYVRVYEANGE